MRVSSQNDYLSQISPGPRMLKDLMMTNKSLLDEELDESCHGFRLGCILSLLGASL